MTFCSSCYVQLFQFYCHEQKYREATHFPLSLLMCHHCPITRIRVCTKSSHKSCIAGTKINQISLLLNISEALPAEKPLHCQRFSFILNTTCLGFYTSIILTAFTLEARLTRVTQGFVSVQLILS